MCVCVFFFLQYLIFFELVNNIFKYFNNNNILHVALIFNTQLELLSVRFWYSVRVGTTGRGTTTPREGVRRRPVQHIFIFIAETRSRDRIALHNIIIIVLQYYTVNIAITIMLIYIISSHGVRSDRAIVSSRFRQNRSIRPR